MLPRSSKLRRNLALLLAVGILQPLAFAQQPPPADTPYVPHLTFDIASVRQSPPADSWSVSGWFTPENSTSFHATNWDIFNLLSAAYGGFNAHQIDEKGIPQEMWRAMYIVQAKGDDTTEEAFAKLTPKQQQLEQQHMLLVLLQDRFKLKAHYETRQGEIYNLVAPKGEAKLRNATRLPLTPAQAKAWTDRTPPPLYQTGDSRIEFDYIAHDCQISDITQMLADQFGQPVIDKTGFTGRYNFTLKAHGARERDRKADDLNPIPTLETAIQDQLGLKLESAKGPTQILVIDHIEKPSDN